MADLPKPYAMREAIADSLAEHVKAYDIEAWCVALGLAPAGEGEDPFRSKRVYVTSRLTGLELDRLLAIVQRLLTEWDDPVLQSIVEAGGARGADGAVKNLIFASTGPKPKIVLRDAVDNTVEIVENGQFCLFYDRPLTEAGLTWADLAEWWAQNLATDDVGLAAKALWQRLNLSLDNGPEKALFHTYSKRYATGFNLPALVPQVYLHYDPYVRRVGRTGHLFRQRMDFLLLLPGRRRVVLEIDGKHHYARADGMADPWAYAEMMAEDRRLRLSGYEVHRFGGAEFVDEAACVATLDVFFDNLLA